MTKPLPLAALLTLALVACMNRTGTQAPPTLKELPSVTLTREQNGARATLTARAATLRLAGQDLKVQTYDGSFPGPVMRLREGERVRLTLRNELEEPTTLHLHGLPVGPDVDDPFRKIAPGTSAEFDFTLPRGSAGTYWYHTHTHGRSDTQLFAGLAGAVVVSGDSEPAALRDVEDHVVVLKDLPRTDEGDAMLGMNGREGETVLVNGQVSPTLAAQSGLVRLRLVNAGNARYYNLALDGAPLHVIARDGHTLSAPETVGAVLLAPGERADVLVPLEGPGELKLRNLPYDRGVHAVGNMGEQAGHDMAGMTGAPKTEVLLTLTAPQGVKAEALPTTLAPVRALEVPADAPVRRVILEEQMTPTRFFINGRAFDLNRVDFQAREGAVEVWEIVNRTGMDHPFHLHTYAVQVLSRNGQPVRPEWKDVVNVRANETVRVAVPLTGFTGRTVFHCHIAEHEERGMMGVLQVHAPGEPVPASLTPVEPSSSAGPQESHDMENMPGMGDMNHSGH